MTSPENFLPRELDGVTLQVGVADMSRARSFYDRLFAEPPEFVATPDFHEYQPHPGFWFQITTGAPAGRLTRLRFGVADIVATRGRIVALTEASDIGVLDGVVAWCDFTDPDGNPLGIFQDLQKFPKLPN